MSRRGHRRRGVQTHTHTHTRIAHELPSPLNWCVLLSRLKQPKSGMIDIVGEIERKRERDKVLGADHKIVDTNCK